MKKTVLSLCLLLMAIQSFAQHKDAYEKRLLIRDNDTLRFRVLPPINYERGKKYPLVIFLHGSGERGADNELQLVHGSKLFADSAIRSKYPAFVIFPQCPRGDTWSRYQRDRQNDSLGGLRFASELPPSKTLNLTMALLDSLAATGKINTRRIYVGGLSMGGMGTFEILWRKPGFFAAAFPICGGGDPEKVDLYAKKFPIWVFHGDADQSVRVANSRLMVNALRKEGAKIKYSEYPGVAHNSWDNAFAEPDLMEWLMKQRKK